MARRAKSGLHLGQLLIGTLVLALLLGGAWIFLHRGSDPYAATPTLDFNEFVEFSSNLEGNTYRVNATVEEQLGRTGNGGRLVHVIIKNDDGSAGDPLGIRIPPELEKQNIQKGQDFVFIVEVGPKGVLVAHAIQRI